MYTSKEDMEEEIRAVRPRISPTNRYQVYPKAFFFSCPSTTAVHTFRLTPASYTNVY